MDVREHIGLGVSGQLLQPSTGITSPLRLGSATFCGLEASGAETPQVHLSDASGWVATFTLAEDIRTDAAHSVTAWQQSGMAVALLAGDQPGAVQRVAAAVGIQNATGACSPDDKLRHLQALQAQGMEAARM